MNDTTHNPFQFDPHLVQAIAADAAEILDSFREVEEIVGDVHQTYYEPAYEIPRIEKIARDGGSLIDLFRAELLRFHLLQGRRIAEHLADFVCEFNRRRLLACTLALRAVLEVSAALGYYVAKFEAMLPDGEWSDEVCDEFVKLLDKAVRGSRFDWGRWASDGSDRQNLRDAYDAWRQIKDGKKKREAEPTPELTQVNVQTMVEHLANEMGSHPRCGKGYVETTYCLLSDMCHPSVGATLVALLNEPADDHDIIGPGVSDSLMAWYWVEVVSPLVKPITAFAQERLDKIIEIGGKFSVSPDEQ